MKWVTCKAIVGMGGVVPTELNGIIYEGQLMTEITTQTTAEAGHIIVGDEIPGRKMIKA